VIKITLMLIPGLLKI